MKTSILMMVILLSGCSTYYDNSVNMKDLYVNNTAQNNFVGSPCQLWLNSKCLILNPQPRNPDTQKVPK